MQVNCNYTPHLALLSNIIPIHVAARALDFEYAAHSTLTLAGRAINMFKVSSTVCGDTSRKLYANFI
jgi:hypothetical protein